MIICNDSHILNNNLKAQTSCINLSILSNCNKDLKTKNSLIEKNTHPSILFNNSIKGNITHLLGNTIKEEKFQTTEKIKGHV